MKNQFPKFLHADLDKKHVTRRTGSGASYPSELLEDSVFHIIYTTEIHLYLFASVCEVLTVILLVAPDEENQ